VLLALALLASPVAWGDEASEAAAEKLFEAMDMKTTLERVIDATLDAEVVVKPELGPYKGVMREFFSKYMGYAALKPKLVEVYAAEFTATELSEAAAFYETPTGRKLLSRLPALMAKGSEIGIAAVQDHLPELQQAIQQEAARLKALQQADTRE
jgi:hypothetical protein